MQLQKSMEDEEEKYQTQLSQHQTQPSQNERTTSGNREFGGLKGALYGDLDISHNDKRLKGTTGFAVIGPNTIELAADKRVGWRINTQLGVTWVAHDNVNKIYQIHAGILATAAGLSDVCAEFAKSATDLCTAVFGDISAPEGVYIVARVLISMMDTWERKNPGALCPEFLVAGYHHDVPLILSVESSSRGGILCQRRVGSTFAIGSGAHFALDFAQVNVNLPPDTLVESTIVAASLQESGTGGHVFRATMKRYEAASFWVPPYSILQLVCRDLDRYMELLRHSLFFYCWNYPYKEQLEVPLSLALRHRFPTHLRDHLISRPNVECRIITFQGDPPPELVGHGNSKIILPVLGVDFVVEFFQPTVNNLIRLCDTEQMSAVVP